MAEEEKDKVWGRTAGTGGRAAFVRLTAGLEVCGPLIYSNIRKHTHFQSKSLGLAPWFMLGGGAWPWWAGRHRA